MVVGELATVLKGGFDEGHVISWVEDRVIMISSTRHGKGKHLRVALVDGNAVAARPRDTPFAAVAQGG